MKKPQFFVFSMLLLVVSCQQAPTVDKVVQKVWKHLGGKKAFEKARYVEFVWEVKKDGQRLAARHHLWDRYTGNYVMTTRNLKSGDSVEVYFNVNKKQGMAVANGELMKGKVRENLLTLGHDTFINDTYWLLSATKLQDPGVHLELADSVADKKQNEAVLHLWFDKVGLTPGDQYWLYVQPDGKINRWKYKLQSGRKGNFNWLDERDCGMGLIFATRKVSVDNSFEIDFPLVKFSDTMDAARFTYEP